MSDNVLGNRKSVAAQNEDHSGRASFRVLLLTVLLDIAHAPRTQVSTMTSRAAPPQRAGAGRPSGCACGFCGTVLRGWKNPRTRPVCPLSIRLTPVFMFTSAISPLS